MRNGADRPGSRRRQGWTTATSLFRKTSTATSQPLCNQVATCDLPAGRMTLPKASTTDPKPSNARSISAVPDPSADCTSSYATTEGTAKV